MGRDKRTSLNSKSLIQILKIISPILAALFILIAIIVYRINVREGTTELLPDREFLPKFVSDIGEAKKSISCAMYMFKFDEYTKNNLQEPTSLLVSALVNAAHRGVRVSMILDLGRPDELTTKYNKKTAKYLSENGINVMFDSPYKRLHSKICLIDDNILFVGSHNFTFSAMNRNNEASARIVSENVAKEARKYLNSMGVK